MKLIARVKGLFSGRFRRTPHGPSAPVVASGRHHPNTTAIANAKAQPNLSRAAATAANAAAAPNATARAVVCAPATGRASVAAHAKAIAIATQKLHPKPAATQSHTFITDGSSLTEVVLCRHTREATLVSTPARPDVEFESPRSDALASYRAFMTALNGVNAKGGEHRRRHTRNSFQGHFGAFGLLSAVSAILSNSEKAKAEGKDKDNQNQKERKAFKTLTDIFSTLKNENHRGRADTKAWSKHDDVSISSYFPASIHPRALARAAKQQQPHGAPPQLPLNPKSQAQSKVESVAAAIAMVSSSNSNSSSNTNSNNNSNSNSNSSESKCNKENVEPQHMSGAAKTAVSAALSSSSSSSAAAAEYAASQQMLRLNAEEEKVLDEARAYYDAKVDADGALVLGRDDISPSKWQGLALYLTCTATVQSLRLQNVDFDAEAARVLGATKRYARSLRHVTLCDNGIGTARSAAASAVDAGAAAAAVASVSARTADPNECLNALVDFLLRCILLESLAILRNSVRDSHVPALQRLLVQHQSLVRLSLCWNGIADSGAKALAKAIETYSSNLREIDLSYNSVGPEARSYVAQCAHHHVLRCGRETRFRLEHNRAQPDPIGVG